jgi:DNA-binding LacI/PurR family transcriptional regulator
VRKSLIAKRGSTLSDVAREVGVSSATVSLVLNGGNSTSRVSEATRRRIEAAASKLEYRPNAIARSLARRRTDIIGFYCGYGPLHAQDPFVSSLISGVQECCDGLNLEVLLHNANRTRTPELIHAELDSGKVDGLVLFSPPSDRLVELLAGSPLPAVVVVDAVPNLPSIVVDDVAGAELIVQHLVEKGHRRVMYRKSDAIIQGTSLRRRLAAFHQAAARHGITVVEVAELETKAAADTRETRGFSDSEKAVLSLPLSERPTAVVCWHDVSAYRLLGTCRDAGIRVPEDLAVIGFNGISTSAAHLCHLTTIQAPWPKVGWAAVELLLEMIDGKAAEGETIFPIEFVAGETT